MKRHMPGGGIGTLIALMLPCALVFAVWWTGLMDLWTSTGMDLEPQRSL